MSAPRSGNLAPDAAAQADRPLAIICGGGQVPFRVAAAARAAGRPVYLIGIEGAADPEIAEWPHDWFNWGEVGKLFRLLKKADCRDVVFVGHVHRPSFKELRLDLGAVLHLPRLLAFLIGGDDKILSGVIRYFEDRGIEVHGAHEIDPGLVLGEGPVGRYKPGRRMRADIETGFSVAAVLGRIDIGQGVVVENGLVLAVEAAEGTDRMLARVAELREGRARGAGVLVKRAKPGQELRIDMPTIGRRTVERAVRAGLAGIAVQAGHTIAADREALAAAADKAGIFVIGMKAAD